MTFLTPKVQDKLEKLLRFYQLNDIFVMFNL